MNTQNNEPPAASFRGHVQAGVVVLDEPHQLPEGAAVRVEIVSAEPEPSLLDEKGRTLGEKMLDYAGTITGLPADLAQNHDHYLHGTPKK